MITFAAGDTLTVSFVEQTLTVQFGLEPPSTSSGTAPGTAGHNGWSPVLAVEDDSGRSVLRLTDYVGGTGTKPTIADSYLSMTGLVATAAEATNIRGAQGAPGMDGSAVNVDARVRALVQAAALDGSTRWPKDKLPEDIVYDSDRLTDLTLIVNVSPGHVDLNNIPSRYEVRADFRQGVYHTATVMRIEFAGQTQDRAINLAQSSKEATGFFLVDDATRTALLAESVGGSVPFIVRLRTAAGVNLGTAEAELAVVRTEDSTARAEVASLKQAQSYNEMIAGPTQDCRVYALPDYIETIPTRTALDGDYKLVLNEPDNLFPRVTDVDSVRILIRASDLTTTEVHRESWTLIQDRRVIDFNISAAEETGAAGRFQRLNNRSFYHFIAVFYQGSTPLYTTSPATLWFEDETRTIRELPAYPAEGSRDGRFFGFTGDTPGYRTPPSTGTGLTTAQADKLAGITVNNETAARTTADTALGGRIDSEATDRAAADTALGGRIDALPTEAEVTELILENIDVVGIRPTYWSTQGGASPDPATREYFVHLHSGIVPVGTTTLRLEIHAIRATDVAYDSGTEDYRFQFDATAVGNIQRNALRDSEGTVLAELQFRDARGALETRRFTLRVLPAPPTDAAEVAADLTAEETARRAADTALGTRVGVLEARPAPTAEQLALFARRNPTGFVTLTDGANIAWDTDTGLMARVVLGGNRTLANPTNVQAGDVLVLEVIQDGSGGRTLAFGTNFIGPAIELEDGANEVTVLTFLALSATRLLRGPAVAAQ